MGEAAAAAAEPIPLATGSRLEWTEVPGRVRAAVERQLGSPVVSATNQRGGFSPGPAVRIACADGTRAFVKVTGVAVNEESVKLHRREARVSAALPSWVPAPRLLDVYDDGEWVALTFEEIAGSLPQVPWRPAEIRLVLAALELLAARGTPCPVPELQPAARKFARAFGRYRELAATPPDEPLTAWELAHLDTLIELIDGTVAASAGDTLVHMDVRADNVLLGADGRVWLVDWPWAIVGAPWIDSALLAVEAAVHGLDAQSIVDASPLLSTVDPIVLTGFIAGLAALWAHAYRLPAPPGLPTLRPFQRASHAAALRWLRTRL
jgi:Phosphotransferase enzyme family